MRSAFIVLLGLAACAGLPVVGPVETVQLPDAGLAFRARVDTGAEATSVHAPEVAIEGRHVRFVLENEHGQRHAMRAPIADLAWVRSAHGADRRPRVRLRVVLGGVERTLRVSLADRSAMEHKLLVGRDLLAGAFLVDAGRETSAGPGGAP